MAAAAWTKRWTRAGSSWRLRPVTCGSALRALVDRCWPHRRTRMPDPELLTEAEKDLIAKLGSCFGDFTLVVGEGRSRDADLNEIAADIHHLQQAVMSNAAARAYPTLYRPLGGEVQK